MRSRRREEKRQKSRNRSCKSHKLVVVLRLAAFICWLTDSFSFLYFLLRSPYVFPFFPLSLLCMKNTGESRKRLHLADSSVFFASSSPRPSPSGALRGNQSANFREARHLEENNCHMLLSSSGGGWLLQLALSFYCTVCRIRRHTAQGPRL